MSTIKQVNIQTPLGKTLSRNIGADALNIDYNNSSSELESINVQDAIDELKDDLSNLSSTLEDLDDVNLSNLQNEQVIKYNSTSQKWENGNVNMSGKADKVSSATNGNFAGLDANGNLTDSGKKASDFAGTGTATSSANGLMSSSDKTKLDNLGTASTKDVPTSGNAGSTQVVMGNDTRLSDSRKASDVYDWAKAATKPTYTASEVGAIASTAKGANNGVAELDSTGKVPSSQLPSFVDDVLEYNSLSGFPTTGETGKIYIAKDTNKTYRWSGTAYAEISASLALGETSSTAYRGDRGKIAYDHSQSTHARTDATKVEASSTNGKIKINGTETTVYTHPGSGTNPHGTTKSDVGLGNVGNFKAVSTVASQGLTDTEKANARANINAGTSNFSGNYNDLTNKPTIPTVNNATLTIQKNGTNVQTFTANQASNATANITVPTKTSELTNDSGFITSASVGVTKVSTGTGLKGGDITSTGTVSTNVPRVAKDSKSLPGTNSWILEEYTAGSNYNLPSNAWYHIYSAKGSNASYGTQLALGMTANAAYYRNYNNGTWGSWQSLINTWRGIKNELTSDSTTESLSAAQGKVLKGLIDAKGTGTVTQVKVGNTAYNPTSGVVSLPAYPTDTNTHRPIQVNGTEILGNNTTALNLKAGANVTLTNSSGTVTIAATNTIYNFVGTTFNSGSQNIAEHNANNALENGNYYYTSNGPATSLGASTNDGALYVQSHSDNWVAQIAQDYRNGRLFIRGKNNGTWQNWLRVYDTGNKPTKSDVGLGNVENKSSATIRGELTSGNVTTALGFTPATKPTVKSATLAANATSVTFTGIPTSGNNMIDFFISDGANYTAINTATSGQITLTYAASSSARTVYCRIEGV